MTLYIGLDEHLYRITNEELITLTENGIITKLRNARIIFFGGLAFSGYNESFNAENGIYRDTISRDEEITQSKYFEKLYNKIITSIPDRLVIVFTHTPMDCWAKNTDYHKSFIYVSGHTHRNLYYDNGEVRIYADNQIGYSNNSPHLKWFDIDSSYDYFADYKDGIYIITADEYRCFYRAKNNYMTFNRNNTIYMLKKNGYYCFILLTYDGSLALLNGGAIKKLDELDIEYYYENMDKVISWIKKPLDKYFDLQEMIASEIRIIGGKGRIHGCIIDIDFYNHIYINPYDGTITYYTATDMENKMVYNSLADILKNELPLLYSKYLELTNRSPNEMHMLGNENISELSASPQLYLETDIYSVSREILKMQKLSYNILTTWYEVDNIGKKLNDHKT